MNRAADWLNQLSLSWWNQIIHTSWQAAVVGAFLLLIVHSLGRRWPAPLRYALLVLALLKFACPPFLPVPTGIFTRFVAPRSILATLPERKPQTGDELPHAGATPVIPGPAEGWMARYAPSSLGLPLIRWTSWLMLAHVAGAGLIALSLRKEAARLRLLAGQCRLLRGRKIPRQYRDLSIRLGLYRIPALIVSKQVPGPMAIGVKKAAILLPTRILNRLNLTDLKAVLAHELAHCQRGDLWLNWVQLLLLAVWWFHPVLWLINRSLREIREDCCDDLLLAKGIVSNDAYCDVLLKTASEIAPPLPLSAALGLGEGFHPLARRLARITDWTLKRSESVSLTGATAVLAAAALLLPGVRSREVNAAATPFPPPAQLSFARSPEAQTPGALAKAELPAPPAHSFPAENQSTSRTSQIARSSGNSVFPLPQRSAAHLLGATPTVPTRPIPHSAATDTAQGSTLRANRPRPVQRVVLAPRPVYRVNYWIPAGASAPEIGHSWRPARPNSRPIEQSAWMASRFALGNSNPGSSSPRKAGSL